MKEIIKRSGETAAFNGYAYPKRYTIEIALKDDNTHDDSSTVREYGRMGALRLADDAGRRDSGADEVEA